jgi:hypothetical protein
MDIGRELQSDHTTQGPETLERNMEYYAQRQRAQRLIDECMRHRAELRPPGTAR